MALVAFLRGVNVGGHRAFRPTVLAHELRAYDVVNVGAAGTFVVRKPGPGGKFRAALLKKLPFQTDVALCEGEDLVRFATGNPFGPKPPAPDVTRFVSVLVEAGTLKAAIPFALPREGEWLVRVLGASGPFVFGMYRRHMKTIGYLGQMDKLLGARATTRNWNTIMAVVRILQGGDSLAPMAGYSGTPLAKKLGIKAGHEVALVGAPADFEKTLPDLPENVRVRQGLSGKGPIDVIVAFVSKRAELERQLPSLRRRMAPACGLWIAWPKKASGVATDMTENAVREVALPTGLVDNKVCAIDQTWSGLRLVIRLEQRR